MKFSAGIYLCLPSVTCALGPVAPNPRYLRHPSRYLRTSWCVRWIDAGGVVWTGHARTLFQFDLGAVRYGARSVQHVARFASTTVKTDTGFEVDTIQYMWDKYNAIHGTPVGKRSTYPCSCHRSLSSEHARSFLLLLQVLLATTCLFVAAVPHMLGFTSTSFSFTCTSAPADELDRVLPLQRRPVPGVRTLLP